MSAARWPRRPVGAREPEIVTDRLPPIVTTGIAPWWPHSHLAHRREIPIQQESDIPASTQLAWPDLFRDRGTYPRPPLAEHPPAGDADRPASQHDQQGLPAARDRRRGGSHGRLGIYVRDQQKPRKSKHRPTSATAAYCLDREVRKWMVCCAGCTLQQTRELLTREIDWQLRCGACW